MGGRLAKFPLEPSDSAPPADPPKQLLDTFGIARGFLLALECIQAL